jgi:hypothetical protein
LPRTDDLAYNQPWRSIYDRVLATLVRETPLDVPTRFNLDELGYLAEHITDDLLQLNPSIPSDMWRG